jgi:hypothetical protein
MLLIDVTQESMVKRIEQIVSVLMEQHSLFKEDLNYSEMVNLLISLAQENLTLEDFNRMSYTELKNRCEGVMLIEVLSKISKNFTLEQIEIFEEIIKRK